MAGGQTAPSRVGHRGACGVLFCASRSAAAILSFWSMVSFLCRGSPSADAIGSYSPDIGAARRLSEPLVVWPSMGGPAEPLLRGDDRLSRPTSIGSERHAMGPPSTSAASCSQSTPAPLIRLSASATEPTARHEAVCTPPVLRTPMASSSRELAWSPAAAVAALLCHPQQGEGSPHGSPPETRGSREQTKYVFGSTMFARDGAPSACRSRYIPQSGRDRHTASRGR
mgnify:CR=1 FL=1